MMEISKSETLRTTPFFSALEDEQQPESSGLQRVAIIVMALILPLAGTFALNDHPQQIGAKAARAKPVKLDAKN